MREKLRKFLARHRRNILVGKIGCNLGYLWQGFENQDYDVTTNGELFVVNSLARIKPRSLVFDVGAHIGEWAGMASRALPEGSIHSFEVIPATFSKLQQVCAGWPNVAIHNLGLGDRNCELEFSVAKDRDELTSGVAGVHGELHKFEFSTVRCPIITGDQFCAEHGIEHIDLLKIDVEGMEPMVLKGFAGMLERRRIGAVNSSTVRSICRRASFSVISMDCWADTT
jgi:FkbM family methyltransferase